ncbi:MAG: family 16 glycosylhydrolase [Verrucomicrobiaceae bacterium]|nr:family 16 glycosylhydrolase [Verrucomicrobiaceae bacterium]
MIRTFWFCFLLFIAGGGGHAFAQALTIDSPRELQVIQRHTKDEGTVRLSGTAAAGVRYRIGDGWRKIAVDAKTHRFEADVGVPAGGWYRLEVEAGGETAVVEKFGVGEVFIVAGQSNAANHGSETLRTQTGLVSSFDGRAWHVADDPQAGASGQGGSFMPAFGDGMARRFGVPVGLVPVAVGATSVREWLPKGIRFKQNTTTGKGVKQADDEFESTGALFDKLTVPMKALGTAGFRAVLWHQGESDAGQARGGFPADRQISGAQYVEFMEQLIRRSRNAAAWPVPWFTAVTTFHSEQDARDEEFRDAMQSLWRKGLSWPGPDTDTLRGDLRAGVHFNGKGLQKHGDLWARKVGAWLDDMLAPPRDGPPPGRDYKLVWQDEFDGPKLDETKWSHRSVGQRRGAWIDPECVSFDGRGHMLISVKKVGDQFHGGMIGTEKKGMWTHGYFECRVQVATEPGMNTAFWIQAPRMAAPDNGKGIADDTAHNGTEIDILEYIARQGDVAHFNLHWNGYGKLHKSAPADSWLHGLRKGFHVYGVEWTDAGYDFFIDGHHCWHTGEAVSNTDEYIILDLEVSQWAGGIENSRLPVSAVFDWVRVWKKPSQATFTQPQAHPP